MRHCGSAPAMRMRHARKCLYRPRLLVHAPGPTCELVIAVHERSLADCVLLGHTPSRGIVRGVWWRLRRSELFANGFPMSAMRGEGSGLSFSRMGASGLSLPICEQRPAHVSVSGIPVVPCGHAIRVIYAISDRIPREHMPTAQTLGKLDSYVQSWKPPASLIETRLKETSQVEMCSSLPGCGCTRATNDYGAL